MHAVAEVAEVAEVADAARRFGGVARVYGASALPTLARAHVCVVGIGGVGSWTVEALARSGIGRLTLIDADHIAESNVNRQVHALDSTMGAAKAEVMRARVAGIWPLCRVAIVDDFITPDNVAACVPADAWVIDAIDAPRAKAALIACARERGQPILVCGAAGGRTDPLRLRRDDLSRVRGDALLAAVRARLRREHGFARDRNVCFHVDALYSDEPAGRTQRENLAGACATGLAANPLRDPLRAPVPVPVPNQGGAPLGCAGYGSLVTVTATMGFAAASWSITRLLGR